MSSLVIGLFMCEYRILSIYPLMDMRISSPWLRAVVNNAAGNIHMPVFVWTCFYGQEWNCWVIW